MSKITLIALLGGALSFAQTQSNLAQYVINTIGGTYAIGDDGSAIAALLNYPHSAVYDKRGNLYIADSFNYRIRKITSAGIISTFAGTGNTGYTGDGGPASLADIGDISCIVFDNSDNLLIADRLFNVIRRIAPDGIITTIAGSGQVGFAGDGGSAISASFNEIASIAVDPDGNIYVVDRHNLRIRKIDTGNKITTIAGDGKVGNTGDNGPAAYARFNDPVAVAIDKEGAVLIADEWDCRVRKIKNGTMTTFAGNGYWGFSGDGGAATLAMLDTPNALAVDSSGNVYIADLDRIRKVVPTGVISTIAGTGVYSFGGDGGEWLMADFASPSGLTVNSRNNLLVVDTDNHRLRLLDPQTLTVNTIAGRTHFLGDGGPAKSAVFFYPRSVARDINDNLYVADRMNHAIRVISPAGTVNCLAGVGVAGYKGDGGKANAARLRAPLDLALDADGKVYIADWGNNRIRMVGTGGDIITLAGNGRWRFNGDGGAKTAALDPGAVALDGSGNVYIADTLNNRIRKVNSDGIISTLAGTGDAGYSGDGGLATAAKLKAPTDIAFDKPGNLYIVDSGNCRIRKITPSGMISTAAGSGECGFTGDGGPATAARMEPLYLAFDSMGNLYVSSETRIRKISISGTIYTIAGKTLPGFKGDGGLAVEALLDGPSGMAVDDAGNVYFADARNHRIRKLTVNAPARLEIFNGNNQKGGAGTTLPVPLTVRLMGSAGVGMIGIQVSFAVTEGSATVSSASSTTDSSGLAAVSVTLGQTIGAVTVTATVTGLAAAKFTLTANPVEVVPLPVISGIMGAGGSAPPVTQLAPLGLARILGDLFAPAGTDRRFSVDDLRDGRVPVNLGGVCVLAGGEFAPVLRVSTNLIEFQAPNLAVPSEAPVQVAVNCGKPEELRSKVQTVIVQPASPEFFYAVTNPEGRNPVQATNTQSGASVGPSSPAAPGDGVSLFATGLGLTNPPLAPGELADRTVPVVLPVIVTLGDRQLDASQVIYAGVAPGSAGVYRIDIQIPDDTPEGDLGVLVQAGDFSSPPGAYLTIKRPVVVEQPSDP